MDGVETLYNVFVRAKPWFCLSTYKRDKRLLHSCVTSERQLWIQSNRVSKHGDPLILQVNVQHHYLIIIVLLVLCTSVTLKGGGEELQFKFYELLFNSICVYTVKQNKYRKTE